MADVDIKIDPFYSSLFPPLSPDVLSGLEAEILADGCRDPLILWNGTLLDGHQRYGICNKHNIPFKTVNKVFADQSEAVRFIIDHQFNRRNIDNSFSRIELLETYTRPALDELGKINMSKGGGDKKSGLSHTTNPIQSVNTRKSLSKLAGVGETKYHEAAALKNRADEETKEKLRSGEITVRKAYRDMREAEKSATAEKTSDLTQAAAVLNELMSQPKALDSEASANMDGFTLAANILDFADVLLPFSDETISLKGISKDIYESILDSISRLDTIIKRVKKVLKETGNE